LGIVPEKVLKTADFDHSTPEISIRQYLSCNTVVVKQFLLVNNYIVVCHH